MNSIDHAMLKELLEEKTKQYNHHRFIATDPIQVPHLFSRKENIEIAAFLTATIAWGNRAMIIKNGSKMMAIMDNQPYDFILNASPREKERLQLFVHRTFNGHDLGYFVKSLKNIYSEHGGLEAVFEKGFRKGESVKSALAFFYQQFFELPGERTRKHIANVEKGASVKRLNMFLRWMVRHDLAGVDFGLWKGIPASKLMIPLDVHSGKSARMLGLLKSKQNNWQAVEEVTARLRKFDASDPVKYDYALFGLGAFEQQ
ncbi:MAG: TIGR02757 family protein [Draconibacterium sp.]|nr:MAG: TIGR02757 family protein [Draconibacterium sp.]